MSKTCSPASEPSETVDLEWIDYKQGDEAQSAHGTWYRGENCNFIPTKMNLDEKDAVENYILKGWLPEAPFISRQHLITTFGSCFARHITNNLADMGYRVSAREYTIDAHIIRSGEGMVNSYAVLQQFEWAFENKQFNENLWHDSKGHILENSARMREDTKKIFMETDVFIITLGLSEVWCNKQTGEVFWRAIPRKHFDERIHGFRLTTTEENRRNIEKIYQLIRKHRPDATVILTLSPVPLVATFRPVSCVTANSVSKAILRVAIDEFYRDHPEDKNLFYFPSYEIIMHYFLDSYQVDNRHVKHDVVRFVMSAFGRNFLL